MILISRYIWRTLSCLVVLTSLSSQALAGFEWTPPSQQEKKNLSAAQDKASLAAPVTLPLSSLDIDIEPIAPLEKMRSGMMNESVAGAEIIEGFGNDIPLSFALHQIVPADYAFSFDPDIDQSVRVNWEGGQPWDDVLKEAIAPFGWAVSVVDKTVWLRSGDYSGKDYAPSYPRREPVSIAQKGDSVPFMPAAPDMMKAKTQKNEIPREPQSLQSDNHSASIGTMNHNVNAIPGFYGEPAEAMAQDYSSMPVPLTQPARVRQPIYQAPAELTVNQQLNKYQVYYWQAERGASLRETLAKWSSQAGIDMIWNTDFDYSLPVEIRNHGTFTDAVESLLETYAASNNRPVGQLYSNRNAGGLPTLVIGSEG